MKTTFKTTHEDGTSVTMKTDAISLREMLPFFEQFLKAAGYSFDGHVDIVDEE